MSGFTVFTLCFCAFAVGVTTMGYALDPVRFQPNWYYVAGWVTFGISIVLMETKP